MKIDVNDHAMTSAVINIGHEITDFKAWVSHLFIVLIGMRDNAAQIGCIFEVFVKGRPDVAMDIFNLHYFHNYGRLRGFRVS